MERLAIALGASIRDARRAAGHSMRDLEHRTGGRFKPSAVGGYERGERDISAERLVELATALGISPEDLLADAMRRMRPRSHVEVAVDLRRLRAFDGSREARAVGAHARKIQVQRHDVFVDVITIRSGDLEVIAGSIGTDVPTLLDTIRDSIVRVGPG